ncbi:MAG: hypothetical protein RJA55_822 [Acidobacteriota bacterium]|jgi:hypothetical protein
MVRSVRNLDHLNYYGYPHYWVSPEVWAPVAIPETTPTDAGTPRVLADVAPGTPHQARPGAPATADALRAINTPGTEALCHARTRRR